MIAESLYRWIQSSKITIAIALLSLWSLLFGLLLQQNTEDQEPGLNTASSPRHTLLDGEGKIGQARGP